MIVITRREAKARGLKRFYSGKRCPKGHLAERFVAKSKCVQCSSESARRYARRPAVKPLVDLRPDGIISRADAKRLGLTRYRTGTACVKGHIAERMVSNYRCVVCLQAQSAPYIKANQARRKKVDAIFRVAWNLRCNMSHLIRGKIKSGSAVRDLGCTVEELRAHLQGQFRDGMTWANYGALWEVDHVEALVRFDLTDRAQLLRACHFTNLQPLLVLENRHKHALTMAEWSQAACAGRPVS